MTSLLPLDDDIVDFTTAPRRVRFRIAPDVFELVPELPAESMLTFAAEQERVGTGAGPSPEVTEALATLDAETLSPRARVALGTLQATLAAQNSQGDAAERAKTFKRMLALLLTPPSYHRFAERMSSTEQPIGLPKIMELLPWMLERHGMVPTEPDSVSSPGSGSPPSGMSSTAAVPALASTSAG